MLGVHKHQGGSIAIFDVLMLSPNLLVPHTNIIFSDGNTMPCSANIFLRCKYHSKIFLTV